MGIKVDRFQKGLVCVANKDHIQFHTNDGICLRCGSPTMEAVIHVTWLDHANIRKYEFFADYDYKYIETIYKYMLP
jgi:hypothetical protein